MTRMTALLATAVIASVSTLQGTGWAAAERGEPASSAEDTAPAFVSDEVLVRFKGSPTARSGLSQALDGVGGQVDQNLERVVPGLRRIALTGDTTVREAVAELEDRGDVLYAEPNYVVQAAATPNDSRFQEMWGLHNTGQSVAGAAGTPDADIDAPEAWNVTTGSANVTVAVLDSGIARDHPDLAGNMWVNTDEVAGNRVDDDRNGFVDDRSGWDFIAGDALPDDEQGHGTHVAGTVGARGNNDTAGAGTTDVTGVAWNVKLMPVRVLDHNGMGSYADLINGIDYARQNGAQIGNLSLGGRYHSQAMRDALAAGSQVLWVAAAGNDGSDLEWAEHYPCKLDLANVVCVAATDSQDQLDRFSNYGSAAVDVAAPGVSTLSTSPFSRMFSESFETSITGRWVTGGTPNTWARTTDVPWPATGTWLTDSPAGRYPNSSDNWARTNALNLSGTRDCQVRFHAMLDTESFYDHLRLEVARSTAGPWTELVPLSGYWPVPEDSTEALLPDTFDGAARVFVRFRMTADEQYDGEGVYVDDVSVHCAGRYSTTSYQYLTGTSMAAPHVTGVAALVRARFPSLTVAQLRAKLLAAVDTKPQLTGMVATGGRINASKAVR
jgi:subtilisin family serine protease